MYSTGINLFFFLTSNIYVQLIKLYIIFGIIIKTSQFLMLIFDIAISYLLKN